MGVIIEITLGGKLRTLDFNNWQKEELGKLYGTDPLDLQEKFAKAWTDSLLNVSCDLAYTAMVGYYRVRRQPVDFTLDEVYSWAADASNEDMARVLNAWTETQAVKDLMAQLTGEEATMAADSDATKKK